MDDNNPSNSLNAAYNDLYPNNSQEHKTFNSTNVYSQIEDKESESNL